MDWGKRNRSAYSFFFFSLFCFRPVWDVFNRQNVTKSWRIHVFVFNFCVCIFNDSSDFNLSVLEK